MKKIYNFHGDYMNYVYILKCADGTLYTGWTNDLSKRLAAHNGGYGAKYTKSRRPVSLAYFEEMRDKTQALKREAQIKKLARREKLELINNCAAPRRNTEE